MSLLLNKSGLAIWIGHPVIFGLRRHAFWPISLILEPFCALCSSADGLRVQLFDVMGGSNAGSIRR